MAEIKIEKKKPIWPWIILAIVLLGIIYFIYTSQDNDDYTDDADINEIENSNGFMDNDSLSNDSSMTYENSSYETRDLSEVMKDSTRFGADSTYTSNALYDLAERTLNVAKYHNLQTSSALNDLEQYTTTARDSKVSSTSDNFKTVSTNIVDVIETLQSNHAPGLKPKVEALKNTASQMNAVTNLSKQQNSLQAFFRSAHELLNNLNT